MTFRERLGKEHPELIGEVFDGGCSGCPEDFGYEKSSKCKECDGLCTVCWDREMPITTYTIVYKVREVILENTNPQGMVSADDLLVALDELEEEYGDDN